MTRWLLSPLLLLPVAWFLGAQAGASLVDSALPATRAQALDPSPCGRQLASEYGDGGVIRAASTRVVLALDEEWQARLDAGPAAAARSLLAQASGLFRGTDIHLLPVRREAWLSPDGVDSAETLLSTLQEAVSRDASDIVIGFTAQDLHGADGYAEVGGRYALVSYHPGHPERDATVLAHEVAHLFGAHHGCDWPGHDGLMASRGFEEPGLLCPCTRRILEMNATRFHLP